jgi:hypothetical protein
MNSARFLTVFALAAGAGFIAANCGGSDSSSNNNNLYCGSPGSGACTSEQVKPYSDCIQGKCDSAFTACYGAGYKTGSFSGPCGTLITCQSKCGCNDSACRAACGQPSAECQTCGVSLGTCVASSGCTFPTCGGADAGGGGGTTCADLKKCCDSIADAAQKAQCNMFYEQVKGVEQACAGSLNIYRASKVCQ